MITRTAIYVLFCIVQAKPEAPAEDKSDLPYGGDMQAAMRAGDRDAIRKIMTARDGKAAGGSPAAPADKSEAKAKGTPYFIA